jgi:hypothetical protein
MISALIERRYSGRGQVFTQSLMSLCDTSKHENHGEMPTIAGARCRSRGVFSEQTL